MTDVIGDLADIAGYRGHGVAVLRSTTFRPATSNGGTVVPDDHRYDIVDGRLEMAGLDPGPALIHLRVGRWSHKYLINIPESASPVDLIDLIQQFEELPPPLVSQAWQAYSAALEAAGVSVMAAELADRRAGDADGSAIDAALSAAEAAQAVAQGLAGKANLGPDGKLVQAEIPAQQMVDFLGAVSSQAAMLALVGQRGDWCNRTDLGTEWQLIAEPSSSLSSWMQKVYPASDVTSVAGRKGAVTLSVADVSGAVASSDARLSDARDTTAARITDASATGRSLVKAADAAAARAAIGAVSQQALDTAYGSLTLREGGAWDNMTVGVVGTVVTYNHGRYYCREAHTARSVFPAANYVWLGLAAVAASADPGGGRLWVKI